MKNSDFNYKFQYENWHDESEESRQFDIKDSLTFLKIHNTLYKNKNAKILEIGCGMGRFMLALKELGYHNIIGMDIDASQIEVAKKDNLNVELCDAVDFLNKNNEVYDAIYCLDVLEHIEKDKQLDFLKLLNTHLSDTGFIVIRVPNALSPTATYYRYDDFTHNVLYTNKTMSFLAKNAGLMYITTRASHQESKKIQELKLPWANIYREEFGINDVILTPNIVSVIFKNEKCYNDYLTSAPAINNNYGNVVKQKEHKKCPKWLINFICCFIPKKKNRENLRRKYIKKIKKDDITTNVNIQEYQKDSIKQFLSGGGGGSKIKLF